MLELKNIKKSYDGVTVLKNIDLTISDGEIVSILGPSGCGKTTLLNLILGLTDADSGKIIFDGKDITNVPMEKRGFNIVFQDYALFPNLNVMQNITYGLKNTPNISTQEEVNELIELLGLKPHLNKKIDQLSGGQKQRVAIARALVLNPKILLCDEATSALDPQITKGILALLLKINKELGITIVVVTHQMEVVKEICNKVAFLKHGKMIATGKPEELFVAPNKDVQEFVGDSVEFLPKDGVNVRLFFNDETASDSAITHLAHELGINFGICQGKLENFRGTIMGSLVINVTEADRERVTAWLTDRGILWEVLENV